MFLSDRERRVVALRELFNGYPGPAFSIRLWDGSDWCSSAGERPECTLVLNTPEALRTLMAAPNEVNLGEAFIRNEVDVEGDIFSVFPVAEFLFNRPRSVVQKILERFACAAFGAGQWLRHGHRHSQLRDRASIAYHYDQPVAFYERWLGETMAYSCAYFRTPDDPLDEAQRRKLDLICRKLRLHPGERFLDIGCGWGSLVLEAATRWRASAHGITLSREQAETTSRRIERSRPPARCQAELRDYRRLEETGRHFDKIASVGMFEHVGLKNAPLYYGIAYRLLTPGGLFLNHHIARAHNSPARANSFISRYVFPDGKLVTLSESISAAEAQGFEVRDVECLREHYELTLRHWVAGLRQHAGELLQCVSTTTYRIWLLYMAGSAAAFRRGDIGVYQILLSKPGRGIAGLPLTREDLYAPRRQGAPEPLGGSARSRPDLPETVTIGDT